MNPDLETRLLGALATLNRVEQKVDKLHAVMSALIEMLAAEEEDEPERSLDDGRPIGQRDTRRGLG